MSSSSTFFGRISAILQDNSNQVEIVIDTPRAKNDLRTMVPRSMIAENGLRLGSLVRLSFNDDGSANVIVDAITKAVPM